MKYISVSVRPSYMSSTVNMKLKNMKTSHPMTSMLMVLGLLATPNFRRHNTPSLILSLMYGKQMLLMHATCYKPEIMRILQ